MTTATETKFLVETPPDWLSDCESERIELGYVAHEDGVKVRVRRIGGSPVLTIKSGHGLSRSEIEIDVYEDDLDGLITAEVEFDSKETGQELRPPSWAAVEETDDDRYSYYMLATSGAPGEGQG